MEVKFKFKNPLVINDFWNILEEQFMVAHDFSRPQQVIADFLPIARNTGYTYYYELWEDHCTSVFQCVLCDKNPLDFRVAKIFMLYSSVFSYMYGLLLFM